MFAKAPNIAGANEAFFQWLIYIGVLLFSAHLANEHQWFSIILDQDSSHLSLVIMILFVIFSCHAGWRIYQLSSELVATDNIADILRTNNCRNVHLSEDRNQLHCNQANLPDGIMMQQLRRLVVNRHSTEQAMTQDAWNNVIQEKIYGPQEIGWMFTEILIKLGLVGTVLGFILMLGSVEEIKNVDIASIQRILTRMSGGMQVALYTTLTGLVGSLLLSLQYQWADKTAGQLLHRITDTTDRLVLPDLHD